MGSPPMRDRDHLSFELAGADDPVGAVLERSGEAEAVLRRGDDERIALDQRSAPCLDVRRRLARFEVEVEVRKSAEAIEDDNVDAWARQLSCGLQ